MYDKAFECLEVIRYQMYKDFDLPQGSANLQQEIAELNLKCLELGEKNKEIFCQHPVEEEDYMEAWQPEISLETEEKGEMELVLGEEEAGEWAGEWAGEEVQVEEEEKSLFLEEENIEPCKEEENKSEIRKLKAELVRGWEKEGEKDLWRVEGEVREENVHEPEEGREVVESEEFTEHINSERNAEEVDEENVWVNTTEERANSEEKEADDREEQSRVVAIEEALGAVESIGESEARSDNSVSDHGETKSYAMEEFGTEVEEMAILQDEEMISQADPAACSEEGCLAATEVQEQTASFEEVDVEASEPTTATSIEEVTAPEGIASSEEGTMEEKMQQEEEEEDDVERMMEEIKRLEKILETGLKNVSEELESALGSDWGEFSLNQEEHQDLDVHEHSWRENDDNTRVTEELVNPGISIIVTDDEKKTTEVSPE